MRDQPEIVRTLRGVAYWNKWRHTLRQAHKLVAPAEFTQRQRVRLQSLRKIRRPVFILGCPRSGTTFLGQVLEALPSVTYYYEPPAMKYYSRLVYEDRVTIRQARRFYEWGFRAMLLAGPGKGARVVEKNPVHTWIAETLYEIFSDALFVVISRDGRDVAVSLSEKPWHRRDSLGSQRREPGGYLYGPFPHFYIEPGRADEYTHTSDLHRCIWIWRRFAEETERLKSALPSHVQFDLRYEELIRKPEETLIPLLSFLGETETHSRTRVLEAAAKGHSASIGRWKEKLQGDDLLEIEREAGEMMRRLGYAEQMGDSTSTVKCGGLVGNGHDEAVIANAEDLSTPSPTGDIAHKL